MDKATREFIGSPAFGQAVNRKIGTVRAALIDHNVDPPEQPLVFYIGGQRVEAAWSGDGPTGVVRARIGDVGDPDAVSFTLPAPWVLGGAVADEDIRWLLDQNRPAAPPTA